MKNMWESPETFTAYATIEAAYYMLSGYEQEWSKPLSPITQMVDEATGYSKERNNGLKRNIIVCLEGIIAAKKIIEGDYSKDEIMLTKIKDTLT